MKDMNRREFSKGFVAAASAAAFGRALAQKHEPTGDAELDRRQSEIDALTPADFKQYLVAGTGLSPDQLSSYVEKFPALGRLEAAFANVLREVKETVVTDIDHPAIWYVYNMGLVIKTPKSLFSIDLNHRRAEELAPMLDFALITHNHSDHYTERFKVAMDRGQRKPVVNNFFDNYGVRDRKFGGYTRAKSKTFRYGDVTIITGLCDHNNYLIDYTTTFEIHVGSFTLFHSGDCCDHTQLKVTRRPDLWMLHPFCGMDAAKGCVETVRPVTAVIGHLQEMGHPKERFRWTYQNGLDEKRRIEAAGTPAMMPLWGDRLI